MVLAILFASATATALIGRRCVSASLRTLCRDIAALQAMVAEIDGEPGVGYVLRPGFLLPPRMFSEEEIERWRSARNGWRGAPTTCCPTPPATP